MVEMRGKAAKGISGSEEKSAKGGDEDSKAVKSSDAEEP